MNRTIPTLLLLALICFQVGVAQNDSTAQAQTIDGQFEKLLKTSNNFEDYKVIKKYKINELRVNTQKHIEGLNTQINTLEDKLNSLSSEISEIKTSLGNSQAALEDINKEKDSMSFFGILMSKSGYNAMVWSIAAILLLGFLLFIFKFKNSHILTKQAQKKLEEVEVDFEGYKRKALEKEQKLGRQLQDERNKLAKALNG